MNFFSGGMAPVKLVRKSHWVPVVEDRFTFYVPCSFVLETQMNSLETILADFKVDQNSAKKIVCL